MRTTPHALRTLAAGLALAAALPAWPQEGAPPPPPEQLPWAQPAPPAPQPPPQRAQPAPPAYRPDYVYDQRTGTWYLAAPPAPPPTYPPPAYPPPPRAPPPPVAAPSPPPRYAPAPAPVMVQPPQPTWRPHGEFAFRGGVTTPGGTSTPGVPMSDLFEEQLLLGVELGLRTTPHLYLGLLAEGAWGSSGPAYGGGACQGTGTCDDGAASGRLGLQLRYHLAPYAAIDPWLGFGVAVSGASVEGRDTYGTYSRSLAGFEYARFSVGADLKVGRTTAIGLFAEWSNGIYTWVEDREDGMVVGSGQLGATTTHSWFTAGPRVRF